MLAYDIEVGKIVLKSDKVILVSKDGCYLYVYSLVDKG